MKNKSQVVLAGAILFTLAGAGVAEAQRMAPVGASSSPTTPVHAQPAAARGVSARGSTRGRNFPAARRGVHFNPVTRSFVAADGSFVPLQDVISASSNFGLGLPPGSVLNQDLGIKAVIDPVTEWKLAIAERILRNTPRFAGSAFYLWDGGAGYPVPDDSAPADSAQGESAQQGPDQSGQQPQVIVVQQNSPAQPGPDQSSLEQSEEPTDVGEFVLVLQNGKQIQAVAFTRMKDRIVYITADGSRHSIAIGDLDSDATVQINDERGTPLQFPL